jgi:iron uptake system component EfeO
MLAGCTDTGSSGGGERLLEVDSSADACTLSATEAPAGKLTFRVTNSGSQVTEFYLLAGDGLRIVGEVENIGPGLTRDLVVTAPEGDYVTACKPGMTGEGIRDGFTVTPSDDEVVTSADDVELIDRANDDYRAYVTDQSAQLLVATRRFAELYRSGDDDAARDLYPRARVHWERIETVAESFGDLDPRMDAREADLEPGQEWTGWHGVGRGRWPALLPPGTLREPASSAYPVPSDEAPFAAPESVPAPPERGGGGSIDASHARQSGSAPDPW